MSRTRLSYSNLVAMAAPTVMLAACELDSTLVSDTPLRVEILEAGAAAWPNSLFVMDTVSIGVQFVDAEGRGVIVPPSGVEWSSDVPEVFDVVGLPDSGSTELRALVTARGAGSASLSVTMTDARFTAGPLGRSLSVAPLSVSFNWNSQGGLRAERDTVVLSVLRTDTILATVEGRQPDLADFQWRSNDASVLRVDSDPRTDREIVLTGLSSGLADLVGTVERPGFERQEMRLRVEVAPLSVSRSPSRLTMRVGQLHTLQAQIGAVGGGTLPARRCRGRPRTLPSRWSFPGPQS